MSRTSTVNEGTASPLGVTWIAEDEAFNFALFSNMHPR